MKLPFHRPTLSELERQYVQAALEGRWWAGGAFVERLEAGLSAYWGRPAVAVSSGTAALEIALRLLLRGEPGEVIVPVWTFTATAAAVIHAGGGLRLVDVGPTLHLMPEHLEAAIRPETKGVIVMHYSGQAAPLRAIRKVCDRHGLWLLEDACHAQPAYQAELLCGTVGEAATLSFHATKPIAAGQGGAVLFQDPALAEQARLWRRHGLLRHPKNYWDYEVQFLGYNYQMPELCAALALAQLERINELWHQRKVIAARYREVLREHPLIHLYSADPEASSWHLFPVFWEGPLPARDELLKQMAARGFPLNLHYKPLHLHQAYQVWAKAQAFPQADAAYQRVFTLPIWPEMTADEVETLLKTLLSTAAAVVTARAPG